MRASLAATFRSLRVYNYRVWAAGALVSNVGTWMQRTAQDWLVFTELTRHDASSVGTVMGLQYGPQLLLLPWTGFGADRVNQRKLLLTTPAAMGLLALVLGILTVTGLVQLWHVYVFAGISLCLVASGSQANPSHVISDWNIRAELSHLPLDDGDRCLSHGRASRTVDFG
jgi:MFS family permease